ncbi:Hypothetical predicted protein [Xyrichtys novacula]|uniref:Uncharacterized protein n=1 Tax=Xyrichtys novacula TaxID=13765 RepID=A0AAV1H278_XYRNO|nr:Hypothetical predicted protein [Xyrichtys novacula]
MFGWGCNGGIFVGNPQYFSAPLYIPAGGQLLFLTVNKQPDISGRNVGGSPWEPCWWQREKVDNNKLSGKFRSLQADRELMAHYAEEGSLQIERPLQKAKASPH